jgi:glycine/D-amino acid oxidase-like deaminating enzyme
VIIGGGAVGCAAAYSLAEAGKTDILLLEKEPTVAAATSSQAAGLVGQVRNTAERVKLAMWSVETFSRLQENEKSNPGWRQVGSLRVALNDERVEEFRHMKTVCDEAGLETEFIDNNRAGELWPLMDFSQSKAVLWCPSDGYLQPYDLTMSYVEHARELGVRFQTDTRVTGIRTENGCVRAVETNRGGIECEMVINAAGAHACQLASSVGIELPIIPVRHEFFVTVECEGMVPTLPVMRIPDASIYLRGEVNSLLCGGWEPRSLSNDPRKISLADEQPLIEEDYDVLGQFAEGLSPHIPKVSELGVRSVFKGWPTFTPDGRFIIGESSKVKGFVMAGGCNAHGVSGSAGIGRHLVESLLDPSPYVRSLSPDRFAGGWDWDEAARSARRCYETYYAPGH